MSGTLMYLVKDRDNTFKSLKLTICTDDDRLSGGLANLRRKRLRRILDEASRQGAGLSYRDLSMIMLSSKATLKRDVTHLRKLGVEVNVGARQYQRA